MKINWVLPEASQCGGIRVAFQYANALKELGNDVICYVPKSGQHFGWKKIFFIKEVLRMQKNSDLRGEWFDNHFCFKFPLWINNQSIRDADITIATSWITSYWVANLLKKKGKKVYFIQGFETWGNEKYNRIVKRSYNLPFDEFITVSTALHDRVLKETGTVSKVVCNGVEGCFLRKTKKEFDRLVIGMPYREARGDDIKNCALGVRVLLKVKELNPEVEITAFGFKKPLNWNNKIVFLENPTRSDLVDYYNRTNIFYVPSLYEGWGLPAMEAMAQEDVVLAAFSGLIQEVGVDGENCVILQDPTNEEEAIKKICDLINNKKRMKKIGFAARSVVAEMTDTISVKKLEHFLQKLCVD